MQVILLYENRAYDKNHIYIYKKKTFFFFMASSADKQAILLYDNRAYDFIHFFSNRMKCKALLTGYA